VFLARCVPVAGTPPAVLTLGDAQCQPLPFRASRTFRGISARESRRLRARNRLRNAQDLAERLSSRSVITRLRGTVEQRCGRSRTPQVWSVLCFYSESGWLSSPAWLRSMWRFRGAPFGPEPRARTSPRDVEHVRAALGDPEDRRRASRCCDSLLYCWHTAHSRVK